MAEIELFYIGTSKVKEIRQGGEVSFDWRDKREKQDDWSEWIKFKTPTVTKKTVKYDKNKKNGWDKVANATSWADGGVTEYGTEIPATEMRMIDGVERECEVQYRKRKYFKYTRTSAQKKNGKCTKSTYTYYGYQKRYKDKPIVNKEYSLYVDGVEYIFFADRYYDDEGVEIVTSGHLPHPVSYQMTYSDVRKNFESNANNSDSRDNTGSYVLANVRANVVVLELSWTGLSEADGSDLLDTLNPQKDTSGDYPYLIVQYRDQASGKPKTGTFFAGDRVVTKYPNGMFKEISVTLTEV